MSDTKELKNAFTALRETVEQREKERDQMGEEVADTKEKLERVQDRIDQLDTKLQRRDIDVEPKEDMNEGRKAFVKFLKREPLSEKDVQAMLENAVMPDSMSQKDITVGTSGNQSDALAPEEFVQEIIKDAVEISPIRQVARTRQTDRRQVKIPVLQGRPTAQYVSETGTRPRDSSTDFGSDSADMLVIDMHEFGITVPISRQMERDSVFDIEAEVREVVMTEMARFEGEKFLQGSGSGAAQGLTTASDFNSSTTSDTTSDSISAVTADEVLDLTYDVKKTYRDNGTWAMTREAIRHVRTLKDADDQYLWQPGLASGEPNTINGHPYVEMQDLVSTDTAGQGDTPIVFGDWNRGYLIVDRIAMQVLRDPYSNKESGTIDYQFYAAHGGDLRLPEALQGLEIA